MSPQRTPFRLAFGAALALAAVWPAVGRAEQAVPSCQEAAGEAERDWNLPAGMLAAIGRVESGRSVPGGSLAWPWTINAAGRGQHFSSKQEAMVAVATLQSHGIRSIDVGCFQINLSYHPGAFTSLDDAFDPRSNAAYAARFLTDLRNRAGSWDAAIGGYHSASAGKGDAYRARVLAAWSDAPRAGTMAAVTLPPAGGAMLPVVHAGPPPTAAGGKAVVWQVASQAMGIRVWNAAPAAPRDPFASSFPPVRPLVVAAR